MGRKESIEGLISERIGAIQNAINETKGLLSDVLSSTLDIKNNLTPPAEEYYLMEKVSSSLNLNKPESSGQTLRIKSVRENSVEMPSFSDVESKLKEIIDDITKIVKPKKPVISDIPEGLKPVDTEINIGDYRETEMEEPSLETFSFTIPEFVFNDLMQVEELFPSVNDIPVPDWFTKEFTFEPVMIDTQQFIMDKVRIYDRNSKLLPLDELEQGLNGAGYTFITTSHIPSYISKTDGVLRNAHNRWIANEHALLNYSHKHETWATSMDGYLDRLDIELSAVETIYVLTIDIQKQAFNLARQGYQNELRRYTIEIARYSAYVDYYLRLIELYEGYYNSYKQYIEAEKGNIEIISVHLTKAKNILELLYEKIASYRATINTYKNLISLDGERIRSMRNNIDAYLQYIEAQESKVSALNVINDANARINSLYSRVINLYQNTLNNRLTDNSIDKERLRTIKDLLKMRVDDTNNQLSEYRFRIGQELQSLDTGGYSIENTIKSLDSFAAEIENLNKRLEIEKTDIMNNTKYRLSMNINEDILKHFRTTFETAYQLASTVSPVLGNYLSGMMNAITVMAHGIYRAISDNT